MRAPSRRRFRVLGWLGAALAALVVVAVLVARSEWAGRRVADLLAAAIEQQTGERAVVGRVRLEPARRRVRIEGLVLSHRSDDPARDGAAFVAVDRIDARLRLAGWVPALDTVEVVRPVVRLHIDEDGLRELRGLEGGGEPLDVFPWRSLRVRGGDVRVDGPAWSLGARSVELESAQDGAASLGIGALRVRAGDLDLETEPIRLPGMTLTPGALRAPDIRIRADGVELDGQVALVFGGEVQASLSAAADLAALEGLTGPNLSLEGRALADVSVSGPLSTPQIEGAVAADDLILLVGESAPLTRIDPGPVRGGWRIEGRRLVLEQLRLPWEDGLVRLAGSVDLLTTGTYVVIEAEGLSLVEALRRFGVSEAAWVGMELDLEASLSGVLKPLALAGTAELVARDVDVRGGPVDDPVNEPLLRLPVARIDARLEIDDSQFVVHGDRVATRRSRGRVEARVGLGPDPHLDILADLPVTHLDELRPLGGLELAGVAATTIRLRGPARAPAISGRIDARGFHLAGIPLADRLQTPVEVVGLRELRFSDFKGRRRSSEYGGSLSVDLGADGLPLDLQLLLHRGRIADLVGMFIEVPGLDAGVEGSLELQGPWSSLDGEVQLSIAEADLFGERFEDGGAIAWMDQGRFTLQELWLERDGGAQSLFARGSVGAGYATDIELISGGLVLERLDLLEDLGGRLRGAATVDARVRGTLTAPEPHGRLTLRGASLGPRAVGDSTVYFDAQDGVLAYYGTLVGSELEVEGQLGLDGRGEWTMAAELESFPAHLLYPEGADGEPITATVTGRARASGALGDDATPLQLWADTQRVQVRYRGHDLRSVGPWTFSLRDQTFSLQGARLEGGETQIGFGGRRTADGALFLTGGGDLDLDLLRAVVPGLTRAEGVAQVSVSVAGRKGAPEPTVVVQTRGALLQGEWFPQPFEGIDATLVAKEDGFRLRGAKGLLGGGSWELTGGIEAEAWRPARFDLRASLQDARVRYLDFLPPIVGDAELTFDGPTDALLLAGTIDVRDMLFADRIEWEDAVLELSGDALAGGSAESTEDYFDLNLTITADRSIRVRNNLADLSASGQLRFLGDTSRPGMVGEIRAEPGGRVYLKEREFELIRGELRFIDPYAFDPELDIALETRVRTRDEEYAIDYRIGGPYSDWRADTTSSPNLPQADINALLLFGMTRDELQRYGGAAAALALEGGDLLAGKLGLVETIGQGITSFEFSSYFRPDRIDLVSGASERGSGSVSSDFRLIAEKDLDWSTIIVEQNISRFSDTYVGVEKRLADRLYARTYFASEQLGRSLAIGGAWGAEFNVRWELD
jgi:autotransporter translocation and assembly factor TamB